MFSSGIHKHGQQNLKHISFNSALRISFRRIRKEAYMSNCQSDWCSSVTQIVKIVWRLIHRPVWCPQLQPTTVWCPQLQLRSHIKPTIVWCPQLQLRSHIKPTTVWCPQLQLRSHIKPTTVWCPQLQLRSHIKPTTVWCPQLQLRSHIKPTTVWCPQLQLRSHIKPTSLCLLWPPRSPSGYGIGEQKIRGSNPACKVIFFGSSHTSDFKTGPARRQVLLGQY